MSQTKVTIGNQEFEKIIKNNYFYIDKTTFIKKWWESGDIVTLITRPRRFGKTLNMDMLKSFFSNEYMDRAELFDKLAIWKDEKYRKLQGTYPVIFLSFADVKQNNYNDMVQKIKNIITDVYIQYSYIIENSAMTALEYEQWQRVNYNMDDVTAQDSIKNLSKWLCEYYKRKVIILLDEYDTPMQEAYTGEFWDKFVSFMRSFFNATFKTNPYLERALMTGITRVSKESIFSDLNNLNVVTTTSKEYEDSFGFTEEEVYNALEVYNMADEKEKVKKWYDGFTFGDISGIYNPWSITNYLDKREYRAYWAYTSSNSLINRIIRTASSDIKCKMEDLLNGREIVVNFDEQIVFDQLGKNDSAIWSLMMASGYLTASEVEYRGELRTPWYHLKITNLETRAMFNQMFIDWFGSVQESYGRLVQALIKGDIESMNAYMNRITLSTFSFFDVGGEYQEPERFYHGFVLGLMAEQTENYILRSNRESGFGRYDVMMIPKREELPGIIMEFKVRSSRKERTLEETVKAALTQIEENNYDEELLTFGVKKERILHYGFAFDGKKVLIG